MPSSYDPELDMIYGGWPYPFPGVKFKDTRGGDVLYTNSTLALNADNGGIEWYFQYTKLGSGSSLERIIVESEVIPDADSVDWINPNLVSNESRRITAFLKTGIVWTLDATGECG